MPTVSNMNVEYLTKRMRMATAYKAQFTSSEIQEAIAFVQSTFQVEPSDRQFEAILAAVCRFLSTHVDQYGEFGYDDDSVLAGRSSLKYWLDNVCIKKLANHVRDYAKMPPLVEFVLDATSKKPCEFCKSKPESGEIRAFISDGWVPNHVSVYAPIVSYARPGKTKYCCLASDCLSKLPAGATDPIQFDESVPADARSVVTAALGAPPGHPKPTQKFKKMRKRPRDDDDVDKLTLSQEAEATIALMAEAEAKKKADSQIPPPRCACGNFARSRSPGDTCNVCA